MPRLSERQCLLNEVDMVLEMLTLSGSEHSKDVSHRVCVSMFYSAPVEKSLPWKDMSTDLMLASDRQSKHSMVKRALICALYMQLSFFVC